MAFRNVIRHVVIFLAPLLLVACEKFEGEQTVPSYLQVDTIFLVNNPAIEEGFLTHDFTDIWVFVDDQLIGAFELPATVPILQNGPHKVALYAGAIYNGISGTRGTYLFTQPQVFESLELYIDSTINRNPSVSYYTNTEFFWMEDFEGTIAMEITSNSDTNITKYNHDPNDPKLGQSSGIVYLDENNRTFEARSFDPETPGYTFPLGGQPVFLEIEYNTNNVFGVGIFVTDVGTGITQHPIVVFKSSEGEWKKAYVNLTPSISAFNTNDFFNVYLRTDKESSVENPVLMFDNLKLINRIAY
jgi:hypothetical protein